MQPRFPVQSCLLRGQKLKICRGSAVIKPPVSGWRWNGIRSKSGPSVAAYLQPQSAQCPATSTKYTASAHRHLGLFWLVSLNPGLINKRDTWWRLGPMYGVRRHPISDSPLIRPTHPVSGFWSDASRCVQDYTKGRK